MALRNMGRLFTVKRPDREQSSGTVALPASRANRIYQAHVLAPPVMSHRSGTSELVLSLD
jgi:hypothetical protein